LLSELDKVSICDAFTLLSRIICSDTGKGELALQHFQ
jgi:hypothetical protein